MTNNKTFIIEDGESEYPDIFKFKHSIKSMFSLSSKNKANNETRKNLIKYKNFLYFNENPEKGHKHFLKNHQYIEHDFEHLLTDVHCVVYLYEYKDVVFTNLLTKISGNKHFAVNENVMERLVNDYYNGDMDSFLIDIDMIIDGKKIIAHKNASIELRKHVEKNVIDMIERRKGRQSILTTSHNDHGMLHFRRVFYNPKKQKESH